MFEPIAVGAGEVFDSITDVNKIGGTGGAVVDMGAGAVEEERVGAGDICPETFGPDDASIASVDGWTGAGTDPVPAPRDAACGDWAAAPAIISPLTGPATDGAGS